MDQKEKIWEQVLSVVRKDTTAVSFKTWFLPTKIKKMDLSSRIVYLECENDFFVNILNKRYIKNIEDGFQQVLNDNYKIIIKSSDYYKSNNGDFFSFPSKPTLNNKTATTGINNLRQGLDSQRIFNPKYTFDNFVIGNCNKYAHAASVAVAKSPSHENNPLFIYGGSGLGKTHLMHAIGLYLLEHNPEMNILYITSEMFTNELIKSLKENKTSEFKEKYRLVDVLLIDDIQFLEGKETTQEEFFHTFNTLYDHGKQIVISSDRPPNELVKLEERLRSRFSWNIIANLAPSDFETRVAILVKKAENENLEVTDQLYDVLCLIAETVKSNNRELEGALSRIISFSNFLNEEIDIKFARRILRDTFDNSDEIVTPQKIKTVVSRYYKIKVSDLESTTRKQTIAYPRQIAMYLCRSMTEYSFEKIGSLFGGKHYSTVMHACDKIAIDLKKDDVLKLAMERIKKEIEE